MYVFVSWSGKRSKAAAFAFRIFMSTVIQTVDCWMSEKDLPKGRPWFDELQKALNQIFFGVFCMTPENTKSQWMQWEAGILSASSEIGVKHVAPLGVGMTKSQISSSGSPLGMYQASDSSEEDVWQLVEDINLSMPERVDEKKLRASFDLAWPRFQQALADATALSLGPDEKIAAPVEPAQRFEEIVALLRDQQRQLADANQKIDMLPAELSARAAAFGPVGLGGASAFARPGLGLLSDAQETSTLGGLMGKQPPTSPSIYRSGREGLFTITPNAAPPTPANAAIPPSSKPKGGDDPSK
jgi:hypothetical protein